MDTQELLLVRRKTHGDFAKTAELAVMLASMCAPKPDDEPRVLQHGREMICVKLARVASGDPLAAEHWDDIAGYAKLVADWLRENRRD